MLLELMVENYAVVEQARIRFHAGLNVLTGETGSGKSIVVDSLGLLLGARASADMIRSGQTRARVSGIFSVESSAGLEAMLTEFGLEHAPEDDLIVEREITANGKSRAFVANRPVTTAFLKQLAPLLGDIHGQNEQQLLFTAQAQRQMLDGYAKVDGLLIQVAHVFAEWRDLGVRLEELGRNEQEKLRLLDLWTFQHKEIEAVSPKPGEDDELLAERRILQNTTRLQESAAAAYAALYDSPDSATTQLRLAMKRLDELTKIDAGMSETGAALKQASVQVDEAAYALRDYLGKLENDPARLEDVESRLAALEKLKRKYGASVELVLAFRNDVAQRIDEVENVAEHRQALEKQREAAGAKYGRLAGELSQKRTAAAAALAKQVESELKSLMMSGTQFSVEVKTGAWMAHGLDEIRFLVSANRGEELKPLEKTASGGELSRIALALKTAAGDTGRKSVLTTLVFDEVDAGVGGAAAAAVGKRLKLLSRGHQVICVTHLAQIAGFGDHHFSVVKAEKKGRVTTEIEELAGEERAREVGRMLSGEKITTEALKQAEQLIQAGANGVNGSDLFVAINSLAFFPERPYAGATWRCLVHKHLNSLYPDAPLSMQGCPKRSSPIILFLLFLPSRSNAQTYEITNLQSGKVLDVTGGSSSQALQNGTAIQQWDWLTGSNQQWSLSATSNGYNAVFNIFSGKVLDVTGGAGTQAYQNGTPIQQWDWLGGGNQQWTFVGLGNGYYAIFNLQSGKVLDVTGGSSAQAYQNGTQIQQWDWLSGANQQWQLIPTNGGSGSPTFPATPPPAPSTYAFTSTSSGYIYPPSSQNSGYFYCYNPATNTPVQGCGVSLYTGYYPQTNAHLHESSSHPYSNVSPSYGYTDASGTVPYTITTTLVGQVEAFIANTDFGQSLGFDFAVGYSDLVFGDIPSIWTRTGGSDTGASPIHGTTDNNRFMTLQAYSGLYNATVKYLTAHPNQTKVCINDATLPIGGKFDTEATWTQPHKEHDRGSAVDIATTTAQCPGDQVVDGNQFVDACRASGAVFAQLETEHPYVHCNWQSTATYPH